MLAAHVSMRVCHSEGSCAHNDAVLNCVASQGTFSSSTGSVAPDNSTADASLPYGIATARTRDWNSSQEEAPLVVDDLDVMYAHGPEEPFLPGLHPLDSVSLMCVPTVVEQCDSTGGGTRDVCNVGAYSWHVIAQIWLSAGQGGIWNTSATKRWG